MRTTLEKPEIIRLIAKGLGIKHLTPEMVHVQAEPFEVTITHEALASAVPPKTVVKETPEPSVSPDQTKPPAKKLRRPALDDTPLNLSELMSSQRHVPRPDTEPQRTETNGRSMRSNEFVEIGPTDKEGREFNP